MAGSTRNSDSPAAEDIPLPTLRETQPQDYVKFAQDTKDIPDVDRNSLINSVMLHESDSDSTGTDTESEFDWEAEDDALSTRGHVETEAHLRRGRRVWRSFMMLSRPIRTFIVAFVGAGILITPLIIFQVRFNKTSGHTQAHVWSMWLAITWAAGCATYLLVDLAPMVALGIFRLFSHKVERMQITVELTKAVLGWLKLVLDVSWAWITLSIMRTVYNPPGEYWIIINRVMQALFSASMLLIAEKVFLQYVAINFHRRALADRIAENQLGLRALDRLSNATPTLSRHGHRHDPYHRGKRGHKIISSSGSASRFSSGMFESPLASGSGSPVGEKREEVQLEKAAKESRSRRRPRKVAAVIVDGLGETLGQMAFKNSKYNREGGTLYSASKLARKLFSSLGEGDNLTVEDFMQYFDSHADAQAAFDVFDKDRNGDISKREMRDAVRRIYRERRSLTASLKDVSSVVAKLDAVLIAVSLMILVFICLLIFNRDNTIASLVPLATIILGFSFIFGHSAQTLFESLIFIFSTHVFDVGDLVMIDDSPMFVVEFGLFSTTFRRVDGQTVIAPNALLASAKTVHNLRRSSSMWETTNLMIAYDTPLDVLEGLKKRLEEFVNDEKNRREWSGVALNIEKMEYQNAIHLIVGMEHRPNWQDWGARWQRRTAFMRHLKTCLEELDVRYTKPVQPVLLPYPPGGPHLSGGLRSPGGPHSPHSPASLFPPVAMRPPPFRVSPGHSRETLAVSGDGAGSHESLHRSGSSRSGRMGRAPSYRSLRPGAERL